jgi:Flp pilus assembly protein TadD
MPENLLVLVNLGLTEFNLGNYSEAENFLRKAIQRRLDLPQAWLVLGLVYLDTQRFDAAMAAFAQAVLLEPRNARARNYLGVAVGQMGWFDGAEAEFRRAIEFDPAYADAHFNLAYFGLQRRTPAIELARRHYTLAVQLGAERDPDIEAKLRNPPGKAD